MIRKNNLNLSTLTTVRIGGVAKEYLEPESVLELTQVINERNPQYFIGGGSNLLIADREFDLVVGLKSFNTIFENLGEGRFRVGASVRLQKLITETNAAGYGGIEYLFSVPGLVGGAVVMNAGRGKSFNMTISDYIEKVTVFCDGEIKELTKEMCGFGHRNSIFKIGGYIILEVLFNFKEQDKDESERLRRERIELVREKQDGSCPNFGSVFMESDSKVMAKVRKKGVGNERAAFSTKTANWILNKNSATFEDAISAIKKVEKMHKPWHKKCKREVIIWE